MCWAVLNRQPVLVCLCLDGKLRIWKLEADYMPAKMTVATSIDLDTSSIYSGILAYEHDQKLLAVVTGNALKTWSCSKTAP